MFEPDAELISEVIATSDLKDVLAEFSLVINEPELGVEIAPDGIYCQKTGYQVATRDRNSLLQLLQILGKDTTGNLYNATSLNVHPAWIHTNPEDLDVLIDSDPIGYACFCFEVLTREFYQTNRPAPQDKRKIPFIEKYWALARANAMMQKRGAADLEELNIALANLITYMPYSSAHLFSTLGKIAKTPDSLANLHCNGELLHILEDATNKTLNDLGYRRRYTQEYINKTMFIDIARTPEDAARGPTNVRKQKISKAKIEEATMFAEIMKIAKANGLDFQLQSTNLPGSTAWQERLKKKSEMREAEIMAELATLSAFSNVALPEVEDDDENDNSVEVRTVVILPTEKQPEQPAPKLTGLALFRAKKAGLI